MFAGFPKLGAGVAVARMALTADSPVAPVASAGYVGSPDGVNDTVAT